MTSLFSPGFFHTRIGPIAVPPPIFYAGSIGVLMHYVDAATDESKGLIEVIASDLKARGNDPRLSEFLY